MKLAHKIYSMILILMVSSSCSTTQKIQVSGKAGTNIYTPTYESLGTIDSNGTAQITLPSDAYYAYLLSKDNDSDKYIPFALDYKNHSYTGTKFVQGLGYTIMGAGAGVAAVGTGALIAAAAQGDEDNTGLFGVISASGAGITVVGAAIGMPAHSRMDQLDHDYQFKYLKTQSTNQDIQFTNPVYSYQSTEASTKVKRQSAQTNVGKDNAPSSTSTKKLSNKSTKTFSDFGAIIEGEYIGSGTLYLNKEEIERYSDIKLSIKRTDKTKVVVNVIEADGSAFFSEDATYTIKKDKTGKFTLTHSDISKAIITISNKNQASYCHPRVNIDGDIYSLEINAQKKK